MWPAASCRPFRRPGPPREVIVNLREGLRALTGIIPVDYAADLGPGMCWKEESLGVNGARRQAPAALSADFPLPRPGVVLFLLATDRQVRNID